MYKHAAKFFIIKGHERFTKDVTFPFNSNVETL